MKRIKNLYLLNTEFKMSIGSVLLFLLFCSKLIYIVTGFFCFILVLDFIHLRDREREKTCMGAGGLAKGEKERES